MSAEEMEAEIVEQALELWLNDDVEEDEIQEVYYA